MSGISWLLQLPRELLDVAYKPRVCRLLQLPREIRDIIYEHCEQYDVSVEDGYIHNFETNKLLCAGGDSIDLSLSLTCRQIAQEMKHVAFKFNKVTFRTHCSESTWLSATVFNTALELITARQSLLLNELAPRFLTREASRAMADRFPQFEPLLQTWGSGTSIMLADFGGRPYFPEDICWGELRSVWIDFVRSLLKLLAGHPAFVDAAEHTVESWTPDGFEEGFALAHFRENSTWGYNAAALATANPALWAIPDSSTLTTLGLLFQADIPSTLPDPEGRPPKHPRPLSAASVAIRFFESPQAAEARMRHVVLLEDRPSIANSPSHAQGLLPFCRSNPQMYIQRIIDVWKIGLTPNTRWYAYSLNVSGICESLGRWILEASRLRELGMPDGSFQLVFRSDASLLGDTSEAFRAMARGTSLYNALSICYNRQIFPRPGLLDSARTTHGHYEGLHAALEKLQRGGFGSLIDCNYDFGNSLDDPESLIHKRLGWSHEQWKREWTDYMDHEVDADGPMPYKELHPISIAHW